MKVTEQISIREAIIIHLRAAKDVNRVSPGFLLSSIIFSIVNALSPYATIWLSAQLINELAAARRLEVLGKWGMGKRTFFQKGSFPTKQFCNSLLQFLHYRL